MDYTNRVRLAASLTIVTSVALSGMAAAAPSYADKMVGVTTLTAGTVPVPLSGDTRETDNDIDTSEQVGRAPSVIASAAIDPVTDTESEAATTLKQSLGRAAESATAKEGEFVGEKERRVREEQERREKNKKIVVVTVDQAGTKIDSVDFTPGAVNGTVARPCNGVFTSGFGGRWGSFHSGIDIAAPMGTPIYAAMSGTVVDSGPASGFGNWIRIQHPDGTMTIYGHMVSLYVSAGQHVEAGQVIAGVGNLGFSTGPHLHFEVHPHGYGSAVDPVPWLAARGIAV